jgi:cytochrome c peroxidase
MAGRHFALSKYRAVATAALLVMAAPAKAATLAGAATQSSSGADRVSAMAALGRKMFFDASLSASGRLACAGCHSAEHAYGPPDGRAVQLGGPALDREGVRAVPSLRYVLNRTPVWSASYAASPAERLVEGLEPPAGGYGWDGRFNLLREQASFPLLSPNEMANASPEDVVTKLRHARYAGQFRRIFGATIFSNPGRAFLSARLALERFELEDQSFHPYPSRYDGYLDGREQLSAQELRGLALFSEPARGNCASCHLVTTGADGSHPLLTDYQFEALGVPRNPELLANANPAYFDQGLCGPLRTDQMHMAAYCGMFKTPTLRNVATRAVFFHNGSFHTLKSALQFYVRRDTSPELWYPPSNAGDINKFDDLPPSARANVDVIDEPLTRARGGEPAWSEEEIDAVIAFLQTLSDRDVLPASSSN